MRKFTDKENRMKKGLITSTGLSTEEVEASRREHGSNAISASKGKSFLRHFFDNLKDPIIRILLCALGVNLFFVFRGGDIAETIGIALSVFISTFISTVSERGSEAAFKRLSNEFAKASYKVRRDGKICEIPIEDIVVGDVVLLEAGEQIPADAMIIEGNIGVDQSAMTGESREIDKRVTADQSKTPHSPSAIFRGCLILSGKAEARVFAVGDSTMLGQISKEISMQTRESPLKLRLAKLAKQISRLGYLAAFLVAIAYLFNSFLIDSGFAGEVILMKLGDLHYLGEHLLHAFMLGLTVIVVAVPEGLPMMIAVVLSANIKKMINDKVLVRKPVGIEAAGSMDLLFTDKTGTLTEGKMSVGAIIMGNGSIIGSYERLKKEAKTVASIYRLSCLCNTASVISEKRVLGGNSTDRALLESVIDDAKSIPTVKSQIPFDSTKKYSAVAIGTSVSVLVKGAPEKLIPSLKYAYDNDGNIIPFSSYSYKFLKALGEQTSEGKRVILIAEANAMPSGNRFGDLTLVCAVMLHDSLRKGAREAVELLQGAGVQVVMITGDNKETAGVIAKKSGIINSKTNIILTGAELEALSDSDLKALLPRLAVVARALPSDKSRLVRISMETDRVVGMTGDGINDAPALKRADIGFAMGSGNGVAKDAGDIIILDNNLASIAKAVLYGRNIFKSIRKFITLQLTMNFSAVGISMISPFLGYDAPITVVQMLWINIVMDTLGGLAFAGEAALPSYMKEKPKKRDEPILNRYMINQIAFLGISTVALCLFFLVSPNISSHFRLGDNNIYHLTAFFALFIFTSVFNCFNSRTDRLRLFSGLAKNRPFILIMSAVCIVQLLFVYLGGSILRTAPLTLYELVFTLRLAFLVFPAEFLRKLLWRLKGKKEGF